MKTKKPTGFTLIELLVVIAIIGLLAAIAGPAVMKLKPNASAAGNQSLLTAVGRARQLAIANHTTVFMVFVPSGAKDLYDKQMRGYAFISLRNVGDQPGMKGFMYAILPNGLTNVMHTPNYIGDWRALPEGVYIAWQKFLPYSQTPVLTITTNAVPVLQVLGFRYTTSIPFPYVTAAPPPYAALPYIAFNSQGTLVDENDRPTGQNELLPVSQGTILYPKDAAGRATQGPLTVLEVPPGNTTNAYNVINIDCLTGRARVEHQEIQ